MTNPNHYLCLSPASVALLLTTLAGRRAWHNEQASMAFYDGDTEAEQRHEAECVKLDALIAALRDQIDNA